MADHLFVPIISILQFCQSGSEIDGTCTLAFIYFFSKGQKRKFKNFVVTQTERQLPSVLFTQENDYSSDKNTILLSMVSWHYFTTLLPMLLYFICLGQSSFGLTHCAQFKDFCELIKSFSRDESASLVYLLSCLQWYCIAPPWCLAVCVQAFSKSAPFPLHGSCLFM